MAKIENFKRLLGKGLIASLLSTSVGAALAEPKFVLQESPRAASSYQIGKTKPMPYNPNILLVMPNKSAEGDEISSTIKELHGEIVGRIGEDDLTVLKVKVDPAFFAEAESKLSKDKKFNSVSRDLIFSTDAVSAPVVNDPNFASEWHLGMLNVINAWKITRGGPIKIGILDTGVNGSIRDLRGKTYSGYNGVDDSNFQQDVQGHGTAVATTAAAITNNGVGTASPARLAYIYPVQTANAQGQLSTEAILRGILNCSKNGVRIINLSANGTPPNTFAAQPSNSPLQMYFRSFYANGGLIFNACGNTALRDSSPAQNHLIAVSAIDNSGKLASFSNFGPSVWFTAPGTNIYCTSRSENVVAASGTSFSCPLVASVAALVWGANPNLTNYQVQNILVATCRKSNSGAMKTESFGYGLPNAEAAVKMALGIR